MNLIWPMIGIIIFMKFIQPHPRLTDIITNNEINKQCVFESRTELQVKISTGHIKLQVYKHISVLCTSKNKSASLTSLCQDFDYTCKLIPKSKPTFQKISEWKFRIQKISQRATILALLFGHFPGVQKNDAGGIPVFIRCLLATREGLLRIFQVFWAVFSHFSAVSAPKIAEITKFMFFSDKPNVEHEPRQNCRKGCYCEGSHAKPRPSRSTTRWCTAQSFKFERPRGRPAIQPERPKYWPKELCCDPVPALWGANGDLC